MADYSGTVPPADAPVELQEPSGSRIGPLELVPRRAVEMALEHRADLQVAIRKVADKQRKVFVAVDDLRGELTLFGDAAMGGRRSLSQAESDNSHLRPREAAYSALLNLDLPLERTAERNAYRERILDLQSAVRALQELEDGIKLAVRRRLRALEQGRESVLIQGQAVSLAESRVRSTDLFLQAGRAAIRDVLEAQEALLSAQNALSSALVNYRVAELELQRDMGVLKVTVDGLWTEFDPDQGEQ